MKKELVVQLYNGEARSNSRLVAEGFGLTHRAVVNHIQKYRIEFEDFGYLPVEMFIERKVLIGTVNTNQNTEKRGGNRREKSYWLNEEQFMFLGTLIDNSTISVKFKHTLVKDYAKCKKLLASIGKAQSTEEWQKARLESKTDRRMETNGIKKFIDYAKIQGSENAENYYKGFTKMENSTLFVVAGKFKNLRDVMTSKQLRTIGVCDTIIERAIDDGIKQELPYKEVFQLAKQRVIAFAELYGKSDIVQLMLE